MSARFPTTSARQLLAGRFNLPYSDQMQDWEYEVADPERFNEFLAAYQSGELTEDERFSLMEVLVQCVEDTETEGIYEIAWSSIEPLLVANFRIHRSTVAYWAQLVETDPESFFRVSIAMRRLWSVAS